MIHSHSKEGWRFDDDLKQRTVCCSIDYSVHRFASSNRAKFGTYSHTSFTDYGE